MNGKWVVAAVPVLGAGVAFMLLAGLKGSAIEGQAYAFENMLALGLAAAGCLAAAAQFGRGDYMGRAWAIIGACYALLVLDTLLFGATTNTGARGISAAAAIASGVLTSVANACMVVGMLLVSRAWRVAGLDLQASPGARRAAMLTSLLVALALAGGSAWSSLQALLAGNSGALVHLASSLGDIAALAVLGPVLLTALTLRGGSLAWPWALLAVSNLGWLVFDGILILAHQFPASAESLRPVEEAFRVLACLGNLSAGLLQRAVTTSLRPGPALA